MKLRTPGPRYTVDRPDAAILGKVGRRLGVPVLGVDDQRVTSEGLPDVGVHSRQDVAGPGHREAARGVGKVVLDVDYQQGSDRVVIGHGPIIAAP